jgi:hypothetical protein
VNPLHTVLVGSGELSRIDIAATVWGNWFAVFRLSNGSEVRAYALSRPKGSRRNPEGGLSATVSALRARYGLAGQSADPLSQTRLTPSTTALHVRRSCASVDDASA